MSQFVACLGMPLQHFPLVNMCKLLGSESRLAKGPTTPFSGDLGFFELPCFILSPPNPLNLYCFLQAIFFGGIDVSIRGEVWPFLLHYYSHESTSEEREALRSQKRKEYAAIQQKRCALPPGSPFRSRRESAIHRRPTVCSVNHGFFGA